MLANAIELEAQCRLLEVVRVMCRVVSDHLEHVEAGAAVVAFLRIIPAGIAYAEGSVGRALVDAAYRRRGLCRSLMSEALRYIARTWGPQPIRISAQEHLAGFYATLGFAPVSDTYFEAGIPHVKMLRP